MSTRTELIEALRDIDGYYSTLTMQDGAFIRSAADMLEADGKEQRKPEWRRGFEAGLSANEKIAKDATNALRSEQQAHLETNRLMTQAITDSEATNDKLREAARLALDALIYHTAQTRPIDRTNAAIAALEEAL
jgi:N-formylglutamate amidohydrolase